MFLHDVIQKSKASSLAAKRAFAYSGKVAVLVEPLLLEDRNHTPVLHLPVSHNGLKDNLTVGVDILHRRPLQSFDELRQAKQGPRAQPTAHVVALYVPQERLARHCEDLILQIAQIAYPHNFLMGVGVAENKVAEAEIHSQNIAEILLHLLGVLVDEMITALPRLPAVLLLRAVKYQGNIRVAFPYGVKQFETGFLVFLLIFRVCPLDEVHRKLAVADYSERAVAKTLEYVPRLLVVARQNNLWAPPHSQSLKARVKRLRGKFQTLLEHKFIQRRQNGRIEAYVVFNQQNHLHTLADIVFHVHAILNQLDNRNQQVGVSQPAEHVFKNSEINVLHSGRNAVAERREHHHRNVFVLLLDTLCRIKHVVCLVCRLRRHADYQIYPAALEMSLGLLACADLNKARRKAQAQSGVLLKDFLVNATVVFKHESVIRICNNQHIANTPPHQFCKLCIF